MGHVMGQSAATSFKQQPTVHQPAMHAPPSVPVSAARSGAGTAQAEDSVRYPQSAHEVTSRVDALLQRMHSPKAESPTHLVTKGTTTPPAPAARLPTRLQAPPSAAASTPPIIPSDTQVAHLDGSHMDRTTPLRARGRSSSVSSASVSSCGSGASSPQLQLSMRHLEESLRARQPHRALSYGSDDAGDKGGSEKVLSQVGGGSAVNVPEASLQLGGESPTGQAEDGPGMDDDDAASIELELSRDGFVRVMSAPTGGGAVGAAHALLAAQVEAEVARIASPAHRAGDPEEHNTVTGTDAVADTASEASRESSRSFLGDDTEAGCPSDSMALLAKAGGGDVFLASEHAFSEAGLAPTVKSGSAAHSHMPGDITLPLHKREAQAMQQHTERLARHRAAPPQRLHLLDFRRQGQRPDSPSRTPEEAARKTARRSSRASVATCDSASVHTPAGDEVAPRASSPLPSPSPQQVLRSMVSYVARKHSSTESGRGTVPPAGSPLRSRGQKLSPTKSAAPALAPAGTFSSPSALRASRSIDQLPVLHHSAPSATKNRKTAPVFTDLPPLGSSFSPAAAPRVGAHLHPSQMSSQAWAQASSLRAPMHDFDKHTAELTQTKMHPQCEDISASGEVNAWGEVQPGAGYHCPLNATDKQDIAMSLLDMPVPGGASSAGELGAGTNVYNRSYFSTYARRRVIAAAASKMSVTAPPPSAFPDTASPLERGLAMLHAQQSPSKLQPYMVRDKPVQHQLVPVEGWADTPQAEARTPIKDAFIDSVDAVLQDEESNIAET